MAYAHDLIPGAPGAPVVVALHGTGGDRASFGALARRIAPGASVLALDGDVLEGPARRFFRREAEGRYDMADLDRRTAALAGFLTARLAQAGADPSRAVGIGYSNGANILANLLLTGRGPLRRMVLLRPLIPFDAAPPPLPGADVVIAAGRRDPVAPAPFARRLAATLAAAGARVDLLWREGGHELGADDLAQASAFVARGGAPEINGGPVNAAVQRF